MTPCVCAFVCSVRFLRCAINERVLQSRCICNNQTELRIPDLRFLQKPKGALGKTTAQEVGGCGFRAGKYLGRSRSAMLSVYTEVTAFFVYSALAMYFE